MSSLILFLRAFPDCEEQARNDKNQTENVCPGRIKTIDFLPLFEYY